ncbi:MAG: pantoate--beta-alanine ligase [Campylobacterota bacterium]|nr:pantoate--beta-alanine ligase [Campylobacterota bacterium]
MKIINNILELKKELKINNKTIGFVPTMGALHNGHISLIKRAREENEVVVVSIFVNPTQFLAGEDLDKYPKKDEADKKICELCSVDFLFMPDITTMYEKDEVLIKAPKTKGFILEGEKRAGHFDGMLQIVLKLLNIVNPTNGYFGKKDAQQLSLITQMVKNFYIDINIVPCDIIREVDGLAMSSRNIYLTKEQRDDALYISKSLKNAAKSIGSGQYSTTILKEQIKEILNNSTFIDVEYVYIVNRDFKELDKVEIQNTIILIAVKIDKTRLIDNIWI